MATKKITRIEVQRWKSASNVHGLVDIGFDGLFIQQFPPEDREPMHVLSMSEADARLLFVLLKAQLAEFDGRKARSQR
ncbi:hypothetical protein [Leptothrix discophora]|uniref:Uncharacterized protein n=1 Tax=Leptothrix discophora TaxID=89 RepID=A0ABT9G7Y0_LEPDI|nr:hypothetical protein [Leptothrix discophora]MDP4302572.1 hypothetical protein [Leptothrix discophora]